MNSAASPANAACLSHIKQLITTVAILHMVPTNVNEVALIFRLSCMAL